MDDADDKYIDEVRRALATQVSTKISAYRTGEITLENLVVELKAFTELYQYVDEEETDRFRINMWDLTAFLELADDASPDVRKVYKRRIEPALNTLEEFLALLKY